MSQARPRSPRRRAYLALTACVLWMVGFELLPWIHVAMHAQLAPHRHEGSVIVAVETEDRDAAVDEHGETIGAEPADAPRHLNDGQAHLAAALAHGHGSLAHHDLAVQPPALPLLTPLPIDRRPTSLAITAVETPISALAPRASARGPPPVSAR